MDNMQDDNALSRKRDQRAAATASSIIQSSDENPDEVADNLNFAREFSKTTGKTIPPQMITGNRDALQRLIDDVRNKEILSSSPRLARWLSENPAATPLARDDLHTLSALERQTREVPPPARQPVALPLPSSPFFLQPGRPTVPQAEAATSSAQPSTPTASARSSGSGVVVSDDAKKRQELVDEIANVRSARPEQVATLKQKILDQNWFDQVTGLGAINDLLNGVTTSDQVKLVLSARPKDTTPGSLDDLLTGGINSLLRGGYGVAQMYNQYRMEQTAGRAQDRKMTFNELLESQRQPIVTRQGKIIPPLSPLEYFFATTRYLDARFADLIGTDDEASSQEFAQALGENIEAIKALPKSAIAAEAEGAMFVDGASFRQTINNIGATIQKNPKGVLAWIFETTGETAPQLAAVAAATVATRNPAIPFAVARGATYLTERYTSPADFFKEKGFDLSKPADRERFLNSPAILKEASEKGFIRALTVTAFDAVSGGLTEKLGVGNQVVQVAADAVQTAITSGTGELAAQKLTGEETDWGEVLSQSISSVGTLPSDAGMKRFEVGRARRDAAAAPPVSTPTAPTTSATQHPAPGLTTPTATASETSAPAATMPKPEPHATALETAPSATLPTPTVAIPNEPAVTEPTTIPSPPGAPVAPAASIPAAPTSEARNIPIQNISDASTNSMLRRRSPADYRELTTVMMKDTPFESLNISADELAKKLKADGTDLHSFADSIPDINIHELNVALATGSTFKLSTAAYATDFAGGNLDAFLQEHSSFDPRTPTAAEAKSPQRPVQLNTFNLRREPTAPYGNTINHATKQLIDRDLCSHTRKINAAANAAPDFDKTHPFFSPAVKEAKRRELSQNAKSRFFSPDIKSPTRNPYRK